MAAEVERDMSLDELAGWAAWFELRHEAEEKAMKDVKKSPKGKRHRI